MHSSDPYEDASDLVALKRFYRRVADQGDRKLDFYDGYRYFKDMGAHLGANVGPSIRARIRTNLRYQGMICKAHAKHCAGDSTIVCVCVCVCCDVMPLL